MKTLFLCYPLSHLLHIKLFSSNGFALYNSCRSGRTISAISPMSQFNTKQIRTRTSVLTFSFFPIFVTDDRLTPEIAIKSFFLISWPMSSFQNSELSHQTGHIQEVKNLQQNPKYLQTTVQTLHLHKQSQWPLCMRFPLLCTIVT